MDFTEHTDAMIVAVAQASNPSGDPVAIAADAIRMARELPMDDQRDFEEERYWRRFCGACGTSPCESEDGHEADRAADAYADAAADLMEQEAMDGER